MMILYGDYKDMNYIANYESGKPDTVSVEEMEFLKPYWEKFIKGELNLIKKKVKLEDVEHYVRIDIRHSVFEKNEYTSYAIIKPQTCGFYTLQQCREADCTFIDVDNRIYITETNEIPKGSVPKNLTELKDRETVWNEEYIKRFSQNTIEGINKETCCTIIKSYINQVEKWKNKMQQRWFYVTEVSTINE